MASNAAPSQTPLLPQERFAAIARIVRHRGKNDLKSALRVVGVARASHGTLLLTLLYHVLRTQNHAWWNQTVPEEYATGSFFALEPMPALRSLAQWVVATHHSIMTLRARVHEAKKFLVEYDQILCRREHHKRLDQRVLAQFPLLSVMGHTAQPTPDVPYTVPYLQSIMNYDPFCEFDVDSICVAQFQDNAWMQTCFKIPIPTTPLTHLSIQVFEEGSTRVCWPRDFCLCAQHVCGTARVPLDLRSTIPKGNNVTWGSESSGVIEISTPKGRSRSDKPWRLPLHGGLIAKGGWLEVNFMNKPVGANPPKTYIITCGWYTPVSLDAVVDKILQRPVPPDDPLALPSLFPDTDADMGCVGASVSLIDPCSMARVERPVRCDACRHSQFFDLRTFLALNEFSRTNVAGWACPIPGCLANANNGKALVRSAAAERLLAAHPFATSVTLRPDGTALDAQRVAGEVIVLE